MQVTKPNFFIVGAWKSGTTSLYHYLKTHPEIFMPVVKETHFFAQDVPYTVKIFQKIEEYEKLFKKSSPYKMRGEASTSYLISKEACENIKKYNSESKIIIMLRDPREIVYSLYYEMLALGRFKGSFEEFLDDKEYNFTEMVRSLPNKVEEYKKALGDENVLLINFDDFVSNTKLEYQKALKFLDVSDDHIPNFKIYNKSSAPRSALITWLFSTNFMHKLAEVIYIKLVGGKSVEPLRLFLNRKEQKRPELTKEQKEKLENMFMETKSEIDSLLA